MVHSVSLLVLVRYTRFDAVGAETAIVDLGANRTTWACDCVILPDNLSKSVVIFDYFLGKDRGVSIGLIFDLLFAELGHMKEILLGFMKYLKNFL